MIEARVLYPRSRKKAENSLVAQGLDRVSKEEHVILQTTSVILVKISIEHKLIGVDGEPKFFQTRPCPVLYYNGALAPKAGFAPRSWPVPALSCRHERPFPSCKPFS